MFTGLVSALGEIVRLDQGPVTRAVIESPYDPAGVPLGTSIAHDGACLTAVAVEPAGEGARHTIEISPETLARTTLGDWTPGRRVNLERSLKAGDELGGHFVAGHVDGIGEVLERTDQDGWIVLKIRAPEALSAFIAEKGSIAVDGVSLTVNAVTGAAFDLMIIPHTAAVTTLGARAPGDRVNLEADLLARYAARILETRYDR